MSAECFVNCPEVRNCQARINSIALVQKKLHESLRHCGVSEASQELSWNAFDFEDGTVDTRLPIRVDRHDTEEVIDPFRLAAIGEIAVYRAARQCGGPMPEQAPSPHYFIPTDYGMLGLMRFRSGAVASSSDAVHGSSRLTCSNPDTKAALRQIPIPLLESR